MKNITLESDKPIIVPRLEGPEYEELLQLRRNQINYFRNEKKYTLEKIGQIYGISRERVRQILLIKDEEK